MKVHTCCPPLKEVLLTCQTQHDLFFELTKTKQKCYMYTKEEKVMDKIMGDIIHAENLLQVNK